MDLRRGAGLARSSRGVGDLGAGAGLVKSQEDTGNRRRQIINNTGERKIQHKRSSRDYKQQSHVPRGDHVINWQQAACGSRS